MPRNEDFRADLISDLRNDLGYAAEYLSAAYADSREAFLVALRDVTEAQKGMAEVAVRAKINRENLYRTLSKQGNPTLNTVGSVLDVLGLKVVFIPQETTVPAGAGSGSMMTIVQSVVPVQEATDLSKLAPTITIVGLNFGLAAADISEVNQSKGFEFGTNDEDVPISLLCAAQAQESQRQESGY